MTKLMAIEIKVRKIGLFFLSNSGRLAEAVEKLDMEEELDELLVSFKQILENKNDHEN